jgi:hypothetical protein
MSRPVARAGIAGAVVCAFNGLCSFVLPAILPYWRPVWLINPLVGVDVAPRSAESFSELALSIALGATLLMTVAFYLNHCVTNQPAWALFLGWGMLLGGSLTSPIQEIVHSSQTLFMDINHHLSLLGGVEIMVGALVVLISWWREPEFFSPHLSRRILVAWLAAVAIVEVLGTRSGNPNIGLTVSVVISAVALTIGSRIATGSASAWRRDTI